jgi:hypothetical protein
MTLRNPPRVIRLHARDGHHVGRVHLSCGVIWPWLSGRVGRRYRWARRHQPSLGRAKRPPSVSSSESKRISPRRARDSQAARSREPEARSAGVGLSPPGGRQELRVCFLRHRGRFHGPAGYRSVGPAPWRVRDNATGQSGSHAGGGLARPGACGAVPTRT